MAKKKTEIELAQFVADEQVQPDPLWTLGEWGGMPQYRCSLCPFDTLDGDDVILAHWQAEHAPPAPTVTPPTIQIYDRWGNPGKE